MLRFLDEMNAVVGRDEELEMLKRKWDEAMSGRGSVVMVVGEAGIGKTTLVNKLGEYAESRGGIYLRGQGLYHENIEPFLPIYEILREYEAKKSGGTGGGIAALLIPETSSRGRDALVGITPEEGSPGDESLRVMENLRKRFEKMSRVEPLLIFVDDLQWADISTLNFILYLARSVNRMRILLVGSYRPEDVKMERDHPLTDIARRMEREKLCVEINLGRLTCEDVHTILNDVLRLEIPEDVVRTLYELTEGNPYHLNELLKEMVRDGLIDPEEMVWNPVISKESIILPRTLEDLVMRRVDRLSDLARKVIRAASVLGKRFSLEDLVELTGIGDEALADAMEELLRLDLIKEGERDYEFSHIVVQRTVYSSMSSIRRRLLHRKAVEIIERSDRPDKVFRLALHCYYGGLREKALEYMVRAGDEAFRMLAFREALWYYQRAEELAHEIGATMEDIYEIHVREGDSLYVIGDYDEARRKYEEALQFAGEREKIEVCIRIGNICLDRGDLKCAEEYYHRAMEYSVDGMKRGLVLAKLAHLYMMRDMLERAAEYLDEARKIAEDTGSPELMALVLKEEGILKYRQMDEEGALRCFLKSLEEYEKTDEALGKVKVIMDIGAVYMSLADTENAEKYLKMALKMAGEMGYVTLIASIYLNLANYYSGIGDLKKAEEYLERSEEYVRRIGDVRLGQLVYRNRAVEFFREARFEEALENIKKAQEYALEMNNEYEHARHRALEALFLTVMGRADEAETILNDALAVMGAVDEIPARLDVLGYRAAYLEFLGRYGEEREVLMESIRVCERGGLKREKGRTLLELARNMFLEGDFDGAVRTLEEAESLLGDFRPTELDRYMLTSRRFMKRIAACEDPAEEISDYASDLLQGRYILRCVEFLYHMGVVYVRSGKEGGKFLRRAMDLAEKHGMGSYRRLIEGALSGPP